MNTWVVALAGASTLFGLGCASQLAPDLESEPQQYPTIAVTNRGMGPMKLHDRYGYVGNVYAGETRCFVLRHIGPYWLLASFDAYHSVTSPSFMPEGYDGWQWEIGTAMRHDALRLLPTDNPCKSPGATRLARKSK